MRLVNLAVIAFLIVVFLIGIVWVIGTALNYVRPDVQHKIETGGLA